ncbi:MAG TPA: SDR family NAD(P)-dependent oxidoreductase [Patescibacteria group bacterium]
MITPSQKANAKKLLKNSIILVTGGTGSFGKTIVKELLTYKPKEIRIFSRSEDKQEKMDYLYNSNKKLHFILGDVRDTKQVAHAMSDVDYVFHAAAQKQVPRTEYNVLEGIKTNILGAQNVIDACMDTPSVKKAIAISTDKAVEPINVMGMTKALQEKLFIEANLHVGKRKLAFSCVRYGNVLGSTGSVMPLFAKQIIDNKNLTVTHNDMTRFLITLDEAVQLVILALVESKGGEIYIPNIPSHTVVDLAKSMLQLFKQEGKLDIITTGIRVGEKLHETLISPTESVRTIVNKNFYVILPDIFLPQSRISRKKITNQKMFRYSSDTAKKMSQPQLLITLKKKVNI